MTNDELRHMIEKADLDDDKMISEEDFYNIMTRRVYWDQA